MMRIEIKGRCRGEGKTYAWIRAHLADGCTLAASSARTDGKPMPCALLPLKMLPEDGWRDYVSVIFSSKCRQVVTFLEIDPEGTIVSSVSKKFIPFQVVWASRINGLLKKDLCAKIRNFDWKGLGRRSIVTFDRYAKKNDAVSLLGCSLYVSCEHVEHAFVEVFDARGDKVVAQPTFLSVSAASYEDGLESPFRNIRFSVELPEIRTIHGNYCIVAGDATDRSSWCFEALEPYRLKILSKRFNEALCDAWQDADYGPWMRRHRITAKRALLQQQTYFEYEPLFSIIVPLYKTPRVFFEEMVESVLRQTYKSWELILVNASPEDKELLHIVQEYAGIDNRIKVISLARNEGITENTNAGIDVAEGDFLCFFDHDDVLEPDILFEYVRALNNDTAIDVLYCDEDKLYPDGSYGSPMFKPDFSLDLLRDNNYICHLLTVRASVHGTLDPADRNMDGAQDHNLVLQMAERACRFHHVPRVLYHWRISEHSTSGNAASKPYATQAGIRAVDGHLRRMGVDAQVECAHGRDFRYKVVYAIKDNPRVSIIMPSQGGVALKESLDSIISVTGYDNFEIVLSVEANRASQVQDMLVSVGLTDTPVSLSQYEGGFNYSRAINSGVQCASGSHLLFMHDDVCVYEQDWMLTLLGHSARDGVGAVGPMICDFDGTIQQAGLFVVDGEVVPSSLGVYRELMGYVYRPLSTQNLSAVSGVCLMSRRDVFDRLDGFDPLFIKNYSEIDYCFRLRKEGLLVVYTPEAFVGHRASMSRGKGADLHTMPEFYREKAAFLDRWADELAKGDPYFNINFSHDAREACAFKLDLEKPVEL